MDYAVALAKVLKEAACSGEDSIYVARSAAFQSSLRGAPDVVAFGLIDDLTGKNRKNSKPITIYEIMD